MNNNKQFELLLNQPEGYNFYQFCKLLEMLSEEPDFELGNLNMTHNLAIQFCSYPSLGFPASELKASSREYQYDYINPIVFTTFMGLIGPDGIMPGWLISEVAQKKTGTEHLSAFFNIFHHRIITLFYRVWKRAHYEHQYQNTLKDNVSQSLLTLINGQKNTDTTIDPNNYFGIISLLNKKNKNALGLAQLVKYVLPNIIQIKINEFTPVKRAIPLQKLANGIKLNHTVIGRFMLDGNNRFTIRILIDNYAILASLYQNQPIRLLLKNLVKKYIGQLWEVDLEVVIPSDQLPQAKLSRDIPQVLGMGVKTGESKHISHLFIKLGTL